MNKILFFFFDSSKWVWRTDHYGFVPSFELVFFCNDDYPLALIFNYIKFICLVFFSWKIFSSSNSILVHLCFVLFDRPFFR